MIVPLLIGAAALGLVTQNVAMKNDAGIVETITKIPEKALDGIKHLPEDLTSDDNVVRPSSTETRESVRTSTLVPPSNSVRASQATPFNPTSSFRNSVRPSVNSVAPSSATVRPSVSSTPSMNSSVRPSSVRPSSVSTAAVTPAEKQSTAASTTRSSQVRTSAQDKVVTPRDNDIANAFLGLDF